ncbi:MAG TPA: hypothetical protein VFW74_17300, partial [Acidimicrobiia bacterium]|nr:hypothetical protein [Acidimicrobiia bacterium]
GAGTIAGLKASYVPPLSVHSPEAPDGREEEIRVEAGLALDAVGRLIEIPRAACLTLTRWWDAQPNDALTAALKAGGVVADLFVRFVACGRGRAPAFATGPFDALDATVYSRIRDGYELRLVPRSEDPAPTPVDPWSAITGPSVADRLTKAHDVALDMWKTLNDRHDRDLVPATLDRNLDWLLLARVLIPATADATTGRPKRGATAPTVDNTVRPFVMTAGALLRVVGP